MATTIDLITADFNAVPNPTFEFLQGRNMQVLSIRTTLRAIEESEEGRLFEGNPDPDGLMVKSSGNEVFNAAAGESNALTVTILPVFKVKFQAGPTPYVSSGGNIIFDGLDSPGAIVQINNAVGAISLSSVDIQHASFDSGVTIDVGNLTGNAKAGTAFPAGTPRQPVLGFTDAKAIATINGFDTFMIKGAYTFLATDVLDNFTVKGDSMITQNVITLTAGVSTMNSKFQDCTVVGTLNGKIDAVDVIFQSIINMDYSSWLLDCWFEADVTLKGGGTFININGGVANDPGATARPTFDYANVTTAKSDFLRWSGPIGFRNVTAGNISLNMSSGKVYLENTNTGGAIVITPGDVDIDDQSGAGFTATRTLRPSTLEADAIKAATIATDAIGASELAADGITEIADGIMQKQLTESYAAKGVAPTSEQILFMILSLLSDFKVVSTTITSRKLDGITASMTHTTDHPVNPTTRTRTT